MMEVPDQGSVVAPGIAVKEGLLRLRPRRPELRSALPARMQSLGQGQDAGVNLRAAVFGREKACLGLGAAIKDSGRQELKT